MTGYEWNNFAINLANRRLYDRTHAYETIGSYLENLKNEKNVSKLSLAVVFTLDKILKLVDKYQVTVRRSQDNIRKLIAVMKEIILDLCLKSTLVCQWVTKQNDHYNRISDYEKAAMERYFMPTINSSIYRRLLRHDKSQGLECYRAVRSVIPSYNFTTLSLRQLTAFKNKLDSFLRKSRLDGTFFS